MAKIKVRRCPFCGGKASLKYNYSNSRYYIRVSCYVCEAQGKSYKSNENPNDSDWDSFECQEAIHAWNLRAYDKMDLDDIDVEEYRKEFASKK